GGTGRTFNSSRLSMTVRSPWPSRSLITVSPSAWSRLITVVSSALTILAIGAAMSVAAMQVRISLFIADYLSRWTTREFGAGQWVPMACGLSRACRSQPEGLDQGYHQGGRSSPEA